MDEARTETGPKHDPLPPDCGGDRNAPDHPWKYAGERRYEGIHTEWVYEFYRCPKCGAETED